MARSHLSCFAQGGHGSSSLPSRMPTSFKNRFTVLASLNGHHDGGSILEWRGPGARARGEVRVSHARCSSLPALRSVARIRNPPSDSHSTSFLLPGTVTSHGCVIIFRSSRCRAFTWRLQGHLLTRVWEPTRIPTGQVLIGRKTLAQGAAYRCIWPEPVPCAVAQRAKLPHASGSVGEYITKPSPQVPRPHFPGTLQLDNLKGTSLALPTG
ncbi:hypothetical protein F5X68DRAFT_203486 [Plectosphaerella plurivora]|uniref:Uncharacterized protein n=1 Tax=Plectosphaerella plurivora TaxID=936078 RepID=A0A9P9AF03_9PEZI|nr:hypothetical protein F5X68DRAFT_203486 [Plectosphaerella plurivora]